MRKQYSATFKADAVKELLKEEKTLNQLAAELGVHPSQLKEWKKIALQGLPELFSREGKAGEQAPGAALVRVQSLAPVRVSAAIQSR